MNRIDERFGKLKQENKKALIAFLTVGDPDIEFSKQAILAMQEEGADIIELGVPFSDPAAQGPVIQRADERAIEQGVNIFKVFEVVEELKDKVEIPMVFTLYYNVMIQYGIEKFFERCKNAGIDGLIIPDLPFEESDEIKGYTEKYGVYQINSMSLTLEERAKTIAEDSCGFVNCICASENISKVSQLVKKYSDIPVCAEVCCGKMAKEIAEYVDAAAAINVIVEAIEAGSSAEEKMNNLRDKIRDLKAGL